MFGSEMATKIATFEASHVYEIKHLVEKEKINCEFTLTRVVDVCLDQAHANKSKADLTLYLQPESLPLEMCTTQEGKQQKCYPE
jgi:hypothetical protein